MSKLSGEQFIILYDTYAPKIYRFLLSKTGTVEAAQDLTSETFLKAWNYVQKADTDDISRPAAFLFRIARNLTTDYYRARAVRKEIALDDDALKTLGQIEDKSADISEMTSDKWDMSQIKDILAKMSRSHPDYADVLILYYVEDVHMAEIAHIMEKSEGAVRVLIHRALKELRARIGT